MSENECRCGRPTRDAAYVCDACAQDLNIALGEIPWLAEELETTVNRQRGIDYRTVGGSKGGKKPAEMPSPANMGASEARTHLKALLVTWALFCEAEHVRNASPKDGLPADDLVSLSRWLMWRVDGLTFHDIGPEAVDEITSAVAHCRRVIDRHPDRQYLGECDMCEGGRLYAHPGSRWARCESCEAATDAEDLRERLLSNLDDRLCTAAEIARLSTYLGLRADREAVRKRINKWHERKRIAAESAFSDEPTFRFGIVWRLLVQDEGKTSGNVA